MLRVSLRAIALLLILDQPVHAGFNCVPDVPPRAALIQVFAPDAAGNAAVQALTGAVPGGSRVLLWNLETGHSADLIAGADGTFTAALFAPLGTHVLVKAGPPVSVPPDGGYRTCYPGTIVPTAEPSPMQSGVAVAGAGVTSNQPPAWTFQGTLSGQRFLPGETIRVAGTLSVVSPALRTAADMNVLAIWYLERLSGPDGTGSLGHNTLASGLLTPTGFPIERGPGGILDRESQTRPNLLPAQRFALTKRAGDRAESAIDLTVTLPTGLLAGFYRPFLAFKFEGVPQEAVNQPWPPIDGGGRQPNSGSSLYLPIIRLGNAAPPRLFWTLLTDDLSNGTRGTRAIEDRDRFGVSSRVLTQSETFIVPRVDSATGRPLTYRLEPFAPTISLANAEDLPSPPLIPFRFPSGRLTVRLQHPDGSVEVIGPAPFLQARMRGLSFPDARTITGGGSMMNVYQLSTLHPSFEVQFPEDARYEITVEGTIDDIWGNAWSGRGTYEVYVARQLSLDTAVLPGTPFEVGDVFNPGLILTPPLPAQVEVRFRLATNSDASQTIDRTVSGQASRFGYFQPPSSGFVLSQPGEYRVDVTASYRDRQGNLWMGSRTWGGVVAPKNPTIIVHGKRGTDAQGFGGSQWFFRSQIGISAATGDHVRFAFHSGDVMWMERSDSTSLALSFQDPVGSLTNLLLSRQPVLLRPDDIARGEVPFYSSRADGMDPHLDPGRVDLWAYGYRFVERPLVRVREHIGEAAHHDYWRFGEQYSGQIGQGRQGDRKNDIKFQYGAGVLRGTALPRPEYGIYGSLFVLVPDNDPGGGTRVFPPFQGNGGGPGGGPIMRLKGRDVDLFIHLTGVRPGTVLETGDTFALTGAVGPPLPAQVSYTVMSPSGQQRQFSARANRVGYYYRPEHDFTVQEAGIYTVDLRVTFAGQTSAGQVTPPFPTGDVLGSDNGRFYFYVVPPDSNPLGIDSSGVIPGRFISMETVARADGGHVTTMIPGFLLETKAITGSGDLFTYRYDEGSLSQDFPNLDSDPTGGDVVTISLFDPVSNSARVVAMHGRELFNTDQLPVVQARALVNGASFAAGSPVVPGSIASLFGANLATSTTGADELPLPTTLGGTTVRMHGTAAPLFYASPGQVNLQVPWELAGQTQATLTAALGDAVSSPLTVALAPYAPAIFTVGGGNQGAILIANTSSLAAPEGSLSGARPARRGEFITIYCTGLGEVTNRPATGAPAPSDSPATTTAMPAVALGGVPAEVRFSGLAPGFVGLYQVNVQVPETAPTGNALPVVLTIGSASSNTVTVAIQP